MYLLDNMAKINKRTPLNKHYIPTGQKMEKYPTEILKTLSLQSFRFTANKKLSQKVQI